MSMPAFYLPPEAWGGTLTLDGAEATHARALRLKKNDEALVLDGMGKTAVCRVENIQKKSLSLEVLNESVTCQPGAKAIMALALSKAVRRGFFMEKASELGAWEIWLWQAERSQGKLTEATAAACRGQLIAGLKQSCNPWLPVLRTFCSVSEMAKAAGSAQWRILPWEMQADVPMLEETELGRAGTSVYVIGPEGGFAPPELDCLRDAGFTARSLGGRILRCETAATLCLGLHWWASQLPGHVDFRRTGE